MKKIYSLLLMATLLLVSGPGWAADVHVSTDADFRAKVGTATNTVILDNDIELTLEPQIKCAVVNLNGHKLTFSKDGLGIRITAATEIIDGTIENTHSCAYLIMLAANCNCTLTNVNAIAPNAGWVLHSNGKTNSIITLNGTTTLVGPEAFSNLGSNTATAYVPAGGIFYCNSATCKLVNNATISGNIYVSKASTIENNGTITIKDGLITAEATQILNKGTINIEGGRYGHTTAGTNLSLLVGSTGTINIKRGMFSTQAYTNLAGVVANSEVIDSRFSNVAATNAKMVVPVGYTDYAATLTKNGEVLNFLTAHDAFSAAGSNTGTEVKLLKENQYIMSSPNLTLLDLNNHTLNYCGTYTINVGTGTVKDGKLLNTCSAVTTTSLITIGSGTTTVQNVQMDNNYTTGYAIQLNNAKASLNLDANCGIANHGRALIYFANYKTFNNSANLTGTIWMHQNSANKTFSNVNGGSLTVTGGFVTSDMLQYLASDKGSIYSYDATCCNTYKVVPATQGAVAEITVGEETYQYVTLAEANSAADKLTSATDKTIRLVADATLPANITASNGWTWDLQGHTITATGDACFSFEKNVSGGANYTLKNGTIVSNSSSKYVLYINKYDCSLTLSDLVVNTPNYSYPLYITSAKKYTLNIEAGCQLNGTAYSLCADNYPTLTINNAANLGAINFTKANAYNHTIDNKGALTLGSASNLTGAITLTNSGTLNVTKGMYSNVKMTNTGNVNVTDGALMGSVKENTGTVVLNGGYFDNNYKTAFAEAIADGKRWSYAVYNSAGAHCVVDATVPVIAKIGDFEYSTLAEANIAASKAPFTTWANEEKIIRLVADAELTANMTLTAGWTLDLNNHTINTTGAFCFTCGGADYATYTFKNGTVHSDFAKQLFELYNKTGVTLNLENLTVETPNINYPVYIHTTSKTNTIKIDENCHLNGKLYSIYVAEACTPTINNAAVLDKPIYFTEAPSMTIVNNGTIAGLTLTKANANAQTINNNGTLTLAPNYDLTGAITINNNGTLNIEKGNYNTVTLNNLSEGILNVTDGVLMGTITNEGSGSLQGGVYSAAAANPEDGPIHDLIADGKKWIYNMYAGAPAYQVVDAAAEVVAKIGEYEYVDLRDAFNAVTADGVQITIDIVRDVNVIFEKGNHFTLIGNKNVLLHLNGHVMKSTSTAAAASSMFYMSGSTMTIEDNTDVNHDGTGTGMLEHYAEEPEVSWPAGWPAYANNTFTLNNGAKLIINSGVVTNTTDKKEDGKSGACYVIDTSNDSKTLTTEVEVNGGLLYNPRNYAFRFFNGLNAIKTTINGGELKATRPIWIQLPYSEPTSPKRELNITGGKLTSVSAPESGYFTSVYVYSFGNNYDQVKINISGGEFVGNVELSTGSANGGVGSEQVNISGGIFHNKVFAYKRGLERQIIEGGVFYIDAETTSASELVEYVKPGHYAAIMCPDEAGAYTHEGIKFKTGKCDENHFWVVIDGEGEAEKKETIIQGTWDLTNQGGVFEDEVPDTKTDVTIGDEEHQVIVTIEEGTNAETNRLVVNEGSAIIVKDGATLNVGLGGVVVGGDQSTTAIIVEPGGTFVSQGTVVSDNVIDINVGADDHGAGTVLIAPDVNFNYQPLATVELATKCRMTSNSPYEYRWQRFAIPTADGAATTYNFISETFDGNLYASESSLQHAIWGWDNGIEDWYRLSSWKDMEPFKGYQLTNNTANGGIVYTFKGNLVGNQDGEYHFDANGFHFFGNSYTAPIYLETFLNDLSDAANGVSATAYIYDIDADQFKSVNKLQAKLGTVKYADAAKTPIKEIRSMQAFILQLRDGTSATSKVDYASAVWGNPKYAMNGASAPKRAQEINFDMVTIKIQASNGKADEVTLVQDGEYTREFENGADADKYFHETGINLYANTAIGNMSVVASNDVDNTILGFKAGDATSYTISFDNVHGYQFTLIDLANGISTAMVEGATYTFTQEAGSDLSARFKVVTAPGSATGLDHFNGNISAEKLIENEQVVIIKNGVKYNALGCVIK